MLSEWGIKGRQRSGRTVSIKLVGQGVGMGVGQGEGLGGERLRKWRTVVEKAVQK